VLNGKNKVIPGRVMLLLDKFETILMNGIAMVLIMEMRLIEKWFNNIKFN
jgi:hypothetical protein